MPTAKRVLHVVQHTIAAGKRGNMCILGTLKEDTLSLQSGTCQAGVNSCQVGLWAAPLPCARAAEGGPHTYLRQQITSAETCNSTRTLRRLKGVALLAPLRSVQFSSRQSPKMVRPDYSQPPPPRGGGA